MRAAKRKAEEEGERQERKSKGEPEERGVKRSPDNWDDHVERLKNRTEQRAPEAERAGAGMDVGQLAILSLLEKLDGVAHDASSGEILDEELIKNARMIVMETFKRTACTRRFPWRSAGGSRARISSESSGLTRTREMRSTRSTHPA